MPRTPKTDPNPHASRQWIRDWSSAVMRDSRLNPATIQTALVLAEYAWVSKHTVAITVRKLAELTGRTKSTEAEHLKRLEELGWWYETKWHQGRAPVRHLQFPAGWKSFSGGRAHKGFATGQFRPDDPEASVMTIRTEQDAWVDPIYRESAGQPLGTLSYCPDHPDAALDGSSDLSSGSGEANANGESAFKGAPLQSALVNKVDPQPLQGVGPTTAEFDFGDDDLVSLDGPDDDTAVAPTGGDDFRRPASYAGTYVDDDTVSRCNECYWQPGTNPDCDFCWAG